jgi:hypothetical protein
MKIDPLAVGFTIVEKMIWIWLDFEKKIVNPKSFPEREK